MMTGSLWARATLLNLACVCVAGIALVSCGEDARNPVPTSPTSPTTPTAPAAPTLASVTIGGLIPLMPGRTTQLSAQAQFSDQSQHDVTATASWASSNTAVATVSAQGVVTAVSVGAVEISATFQEMTGRARVDVQRATFDIIGNVHEAAPTQDVSLAGARVEVVGGPLDGRSTTTDGSGSFRLPGVAGAGFALKVKMPNYEDVQFNVVDLPRDANPNISMLPNAGTVSFEIVGNDVCVELPRDASLPAWDGFWYGRRMGTFVAYHDGVVSATGTYPFYMNNFALIYFVLPDGRAQEVGSAASGARVTGGRRYFFVAGGDFEYCAGNFLGARPYRITLTHPR